MASSAPGWQTDELVEEWVESSPSPPPTLQKLAQPPTSFKPSYHSLRDVDSVQAKRGSLRGLGHAPARGLPPSRSKSLNSLNDKAKGYDEVKRQTSGLLSPPSSRSSSGAGGIEGKIEPTEGAVGTFVVKEGVEDDRGQHLARAGAKKSGKDIFGALPLERMFEPPSPPVPSASTSTPQAPLGNYQAALETNDTEPRRASHPYAPIFPSRLSKSMTPSTASSSFSGPSSSIQPEAGMNNDENPENVTFDYQRGSVVGNDTVPEVEETVEPPVEPFSETANAQAQVYPSLPQGEFSFFYPPNGQSTSSRISDQPVFDPSELSHSTLNGKQKRASKPGLRLFRSTYDTYTREHLSAVVDSIAIDISPSPSGSHQGDPESGEPWISPNDSDSSRQSDSTPSSNADSRSSKRLRLSPPSPPRRIPLRDWGAQGKAMMANIRERGVEASTASLSQSSSSPQREQELGSSHGHPMDQPIAETLMVDQQYKPGHRSNPSTTSSGYLRAAEDLMRRIKSRVVSGSASGVDSPAEFGGRVLSETDDNISDLDRMDSCLEAISNAKGKRKVDPSPRKLLQQFSMLEESRRSLERSSMSSDDDVTRRSESRAIAADIFESEEDDDLAQEEVDAIGSLPKRAPTGFNAEDLNRFISSSTVNTLANTNTGTTISTSFVKHRGSRAGATTATPGKVGMRMIRPDEVVGLVPERVGKMVYDRETQRWVRAGGSGALARISEGGSRKSSEESQDVFAGLESWRDDVREAEEEERGTACEDFSKKSEDGPQHPVNLAVNIEAATLPLIRSSVFSSPQDRPKPVHASSAPPILTPAAHTTAHIGGGSQPTPAPLRSALRQPNSSTPGAGIKKRAGWHEDLTPGPARDASKTPGSSGNKRSVSFSDGRKSGKIMDVEVEVTTFETSLQYITAKGSAPKSHPPLQPSRKGKENWTPAEDFFSEKDGSSASVDAKSWLPSTRTKRIQGVLEELGDLNETETPSKPPPNRADHELSYNASSVRPDDDESTVTIRPFGTTHASRSRRNDTFANGNATFLTECSFGVAHDNLVQLITDVQPFEPYWETLKAIDLSGRGVDSLARLKEMLPALEEVNLNDNLISYLSGIPPTVETLLAANNKLTSLTSVDHLRNLKVLDLTGNQLDSVSQLACLNHLEDLVLDMNAISDIKDLFPLKTLHRLSAGGNKLTHLDLSTSQWQRLTSLKLKDNEITSLSCLERLQSLRTLDLDGNKIGSLRSATPLIALRTLRVSDSELTALNLADFPKLRTLYADGNRLIGLQRTSGINSGRLENLSLRNQRGGILRVPESELRSVKRLYVSGNPLPIDFLPSSPLPSLLYLEMAACSLAVLPSSMASRTPYLRILNLNYNFLSRLDGLEGLRSLRKLTIVGCRLDGHNAKGMAEIMKTLPGLEEIDMRMNPSTLSLYLPILSNPTLPLMEDEGKYPRDKSYIQPSTRRNNVVKTKSQQPTILTWTEQDAQFRKSLPDEWYSRRLVYRGLIMRYCPDLEMLDGVKVEDGERRKAEGLLRHLREEA